VGFISKAKWGNLPSPNNCRKEGENQSIAAVTSDSTSIKKQYISVDKHIVLDNVEEILR
jgi:hypothetical protein